MEAVRQISFVDCPGHEVLMATMLNGAAVMDAAMLVVAANEEFPQPQTLEHLAAMEIMQLKHLIVLQNKVDIVSRAQAQAQHKRIVSVLKGTIAENAPIIPISAQSNANIDMCIQQLCKIPVPKRDTVSDARMVVVRSFCVNKPNTTPNNLIGGVIGGSLLRGTLRHGQLVELRPGLVIIQNKIQTCKPLVTRIESIFADKDQFETVTPGGLIGIGTHLDPSLSRGDRLIGQILGPVGTLPPIYATLEANVVLLKRNSVDVVDDDDPHVRQDSNKRDRDHHRREKKLIKGETLMVHTGSAKTEALVIAARKDMVRFTLTIPLCLDVGDRITISRRGEGTRGRTWRLIGWGQMRKGDLAIVETPDLPSPHITHASS
jgi:translation initiation factor 2 subunit 3